MRRTVSRVLSSPVSRRRRPFLYSLRCHRLPAALPGGIDRADLHPAFDSWVASLFGLAPDRVCHAVFVAKDAVSSYLTVSPLPCHPLTDGLAVSFLLHCPSQVPHETSAWPLASILLYGARTFLPPLRFLQAAGDRPSYANAVVLAQEAELVACGAPWLGCPDAGTNKIRWQLGQL